MTKIHLDTCVVVYLIEKVFPFSGQIESQIASLAEYELCVSPLVEMEFLVFLFAIKMTPLLIFFQTSSAHKPIYL
jgi:hypothetical protein